VLPDTAELLSDHTTLRLGGPATAWVRATTEQELVEALSSIEGPVLVVGGGSNLVVADAGFDGTVVEVATSGVRADVEGDDDPTCGGAMVTVAAGETWEDVVARAVEQEWVGVEALAGIPGLVGATPIQNVGAYGQEVSQTIAQVRVWDRVLKGVRTFANADCRFGYRTSRFKAEQLATGTERHVVLDVTFQLRQGSLGAPVQYAELARTLGLEQGQRAPLSDVREAVLELRRSKGMVLDPDDHDTWSAGSFFTNPVVGEGDVPPGAPAWPQPDGGVKTSAAWLIEQAGFHKGHGTGPVGLSTKHTLALTNRGGATTEQLLALAREVRDGVEATHGIRLVNEPVLVGCEL
jgi:UDP-N-acetylmuramate dehydrogenase